MTSDILSEIATYPNPELEVLGDNKPRWNTPDHRRAAFHNLGSVTRYTQSFRSARVLHFEKSVDPGIQLREDVRQLTSMTSFSAMVVAKGAHILYERYAPDFSPHQAHSIQSITKTMFNLIIGRQVERGAIELHRRVGEYLPEIGSGYAEATVQQVLDMDVVNDYSEDYTNPDAMYWIHEEAMGWRLPRHPKKELLMRDFLAGIESKNTRNLTRNAQYKSANTDVLGWMTERVTGLPLRCFLADITDAAGLAGLLTITTDRAGFPTVDGGACMSARDLARYGELLLRRGYGVDGRQVGSPAFIDASVRGEGRQLPDFSPIVDLRYHNQLMTDGRFIGHAGYAGQFLLVDLTSGVVCVFFSVSEEKDGLSNSYRPAVITMLRDIGRSY